MGNCFPTSSKGHRLDSNSAFDSNTPPRTPPQNEEEARIARLQAAERRAKEASTRGGTGTLSAKLEREKQKTNKELRMQGGASSNQEGGLSVCVIFEYFMWIRYLKLCLKTNTPSFIIVESGFLK